MQTDSLPILTFHTLGDESSAITFPSSVFKHRVAALHEFGYRTSSLRDAIACIHQRARFPSRSLIITFDDGYKTMYDIAFPILQRYQLTATVFLTVGETPNDRLPALEGHTMLSWNEVREMQKYGITFGAHTLTHPNLTRLTNEHVEFEMRMSKEIIEQALGVAVEVFAYPLGRFNTCTRAIAQKYFIGACTDALGLAHTNSDPYALERVDAYYLRDEKLFALIPTRLFEPYLRARNFPRRIRRLLFPQ